jgi:hypothetical protein
MQTGSPPARSSRSSDPSWTCASPKATCPRSTTPIRRQERREHPRSESRPSRSPSIWGTRSTVRCVAMSSTDGLKRGMQEAKDTGAPIKVPVGPNTTGRLFDLLGNPLEEGRRASDAPGKTLGAVQTEKRRLLADPPCGAELRGPAADRRGVRDRHQGRRPAVPVREGRQDRPVRRCGCRQDRADPGADPDHRGRRRVASRCSAASASAPVRATTSGSRWPRRTYTTADGSRQQRARQRRSSSSAR